MSKFSIRLKALRLSHNYTLRQLSKLAGISFTAINAWENEKREPSYKSLEALADVFNCDIDYLTGKSDVKNSAANSLGYDTLYDAEKARQQLPDGLTEDERFWLEIYRSVSPEVQDIFLTMVSSFDQQSEEARQMLLRLIRAALGDQA